MAKSNGVVPKPAPPEPKHNEAESLCVELVLRVKRLEAALTALLDTTAPSGRIDAKAILESELIEPSATAG